MGGKHKSTLAFWRQTIKNKFDAANFNTGGGFERNALNHTHVHLHWFCHRAHHEFICGSVGRANKPSMAHMPCRPPMSFFCSGPSAHVVYVLPSARAVSAVPSAHVVCVLPSVHAAYAVPSCHVVHVIAYCLNTIRYNLCGAGAGPTPKECNKNAQAVDAKTSVNVRCYCGCRMQRMFANTKGP